MRTLDKFKKEAPPSFALLFFFVFCFTFIGVCFYVGTCKKCAKRIVGSLLVHETGRATTKIMRPEYVKLYYILTRSSIVMLLYIFNYFYMVCC